MNTTDLMKDPFYASILFEIESRIAAADREARSRQLNFTDSQIRSILNKVRKSADGGAPQLPTGSDREQLLAALYAELVRLRTTIRVKTPKSNTADLPMRDWILSLRAVEDSIRLRSAGPGSRDYLDFLDGFIAQGGDGLGVSG